MPLDVSVPDPPPLSGPRPGGAYNDVTPPGTDAGDDYHRDEIEATLADGAWADSFEAWATGTELAESEFRVLVRHGLIEQLDFYWDPATEDVGYRVPDLSDDAREALAAGTDAVESELDALGRVVSETLANDYLVRDGGTVGFVAGGGE